MCVPKAELFRRLRRLRAALAKHTKYINHGGCAVLAGMVGAELLRMDILCDVATAGGVPARAAREGVQNFADPSEWDANGLRRSHLVVRFRVDAHTYTWDIDGLYRNAHVGLWGRAAGKFGDGLTIDECRAIASAPRRWNPTFDRKQMPLMQHLVIHHLRYGL